MRVLIITALYPPAVGGAATYFGSIVPGLVAHPGIDGIAVLTESMPGQPQRSGEGPLRVLRHLPTRASAPRRRWLAHGLSYALTQCRFAAHLPALVQRYSIDLVHFHTRYRGRLFYSTLRRCSAPVVADLRDKMTDPARLVGVANWLLCCGEGVRRYATEGGYPAEQTSLVPVPFIPPAVPSRDRVVAARHRYGLGDDPYLLFIGDITRNKGVYELLEAYRRWRACHPQVGLVLAGVNRERKRFVSQVRRTAGSTYLGWVPHQDALSLMRGAEIFVLPSRSEGLPRTILEAVAAGTKVVCPPGVPEFERCMPEFVLPEVSVDAIEEMLTAVRSYAHLPNYPFSVHQVGNVLARLTETYRAILAVQAQ